MPYNVRVSRPRFICLALALVTLLAYLPVRHDGFILYDDADYISGNPPVRDGLTWAGVKWAFTTSHASNWHPLTWLSHMLDCELFGLDPGPHHLVNVMIHAASTVVLFLWLFYLTGALWAAAMVAALFAWHPLHVESVAWAAERKDTLSTLMAMLSLWAYAHFGKEDNRRAFKLALLFFTLGLLAKPMLVTLPFVLLLLDFWPLRRFEKSGVLRLALEKWPFFALAAGSSVVTYLSQRASSVLTLQQWPLPMRLGNVPLSYGQYLLKTVWPTRLAVMYPLPDQMPWGGVAVSSAALLAVSWSVWRARRGSPFLLMGWCWFLGTLVPVIGLVQAGRQAFADRYTYLPLVGIFIAIVFGVRKLAAHLHLGKMAVGVLAGTTLLGCLLVTEHQLRFWRDDESLWGRAIAVTRNNMVAHTNLGTTFEAQNRKAEALSEYLRALRVDPYSVEAHNNLGNFLDAAGHPAEAMAHYRKSISLYPKASLTHCNLGVTLVELGRYDEAMREYDEAARLAPDDPRPHYLMAKAALKQGDSAAAAAHFRDALNRNKDDIRSLTFLARLLASDPNPHIRDGAEAVTLASHANELTGEASPYVLDVLAMAEAETGNFGQAQQTEKKALELADGQTNVTDELDSHLKVFEARQPWHKPPAPTAPTAP
jgi:tetratricopeptide (TPR) repeat protein